MKEEVLGAFSEMLDVSTDIDRAILFGPDEVYASNMPAELQPTVMAQAAELVRLGGSRASDMGSQPLTQLVVDTPQGFVFMARELADGGMTVLATGGRGSRVGLVLYDLKTCLRDAREALGGGTVDGATAGADAEGEEA